MANFGLAKNSPWYGPNFFDLVTWTIGAEVSHVINVAMQLQTARGVNLGAPAHFRFFLSDVSTGIGITATALTSAIVIGTNGALLLSDVSEEMCTLVTNATGQVDVNLTQSASPQSYYPCILLPNGNVLVGPKITF
jgi:hypothetical protein